MATAPSQTPAIPAFPHLSTRAKVGHAPTRYRLFMAGRQSKLTPEIAEAFFNRYKNSSNAAASADACGIGERTLYDWLGHGERQLGGKYWDFLDAFTKLRGEIRDIPAARHRRIALGGIERKPKRRSYLTEKLRRRTGSNGLPVERRGFELAVPRRNL